MIIKLVDFMIPLVVVDIQIKQLKTLFFVSTNQHPFKRFISYFKFDDVMMRTHRLKPFQETCYNPSWITYDGSYMIGCEYIESK